MSNDTISDQIFKSHTSSKKVEPGEFVDCDIDLVMVHEQLGGRIAPEFRHLGAEQLHDPDKVFFILDHWTPPPDVRAAKMHQVANKFASDFQIKWNMGQNQGICHQVLPEQGFAKPGALIVGSDSHTTTNGVFNCLGIGIGASDVVRVFSTGKLWFKIPETNRINFTGQLGPKSMGKDVILHLLQEWKTDGAIYECFEFGGDGLKNLSIDARMTIANMSVEMGAKCGVFEHDSRLQRWLVQHPSQAEYHFSSHVITPQPSASYKSINDVDLSTIPPLVARPYSPDNVCPVEELGEIAIDEVFIGSCTNGRLEDLRIAAKIIQHQHVAPGVKFIVIPASIEVYLAALQEGLLEIFIKAGGVVEHPTCGPCIGGHLGVLGPNEVCVSTTNRNFRGRMGDPSSQTYLTSPAVAAASAVKGIITIPEHPIWEDM